MQGKPGEHVRGAPVDSGAGGRVARAVNVRLVAIAPVEAEQDACGAAGSQKRVGELSSHLSGDLRGDSERCIGALCA
jgi:hypothetical protein